MTHFSPTRRSSDLKFIAIILAFGGLAQIDAAAVPRRNLDADIARIRHPARRRRQRVERRRVVHELREENGRTLHAMAFRVTWFRSEEHTSELPSLMRISYAVFCLQKKKPI